MKEVVVGLLLMKKLMKIKSFSGGVYVRKIKTVREKDSPCDRRQ